MLEHKEDSRSIASFAEDVRSYLQGYARVVDVQHVENAKDIPPHKRVFALIKEYVVSEGLDDPEIAKEIIVNRVAANHTQQPQARMHIYLSTQNESDIVIWLISESFPCGQEFRNCFPRLLGCDQPDSYGLSA